MSSDSYPTHWAIATISDLTEFVTSGSRGWAQHYSDAGPLFLRVGNLDHDTISLDLTEVQHVSPPDGAEGERTRVRKDDVLLSITAEVGMVGLVPETIDTAYVNQHVALLRPLRSVFSAGFAYVLIDPDGLQKAARAAQYGATKQGLSLDQVRSFSVPVPPLGEQLRIVEAIESYLSRLDDAIASLQRVKAKLKSYRASVLKAAVEGRLVPTEASLARAENRSYEPASVLLARILDERRRRWAESGRRGKYEEPTPPDTSNLPELPEGWCWASVEQLGEVSGGLTMNAARERHKGKLPYLRVANVYANRLVLDEIKYIGVADEELRRALVEAGDLLVVEGNGSVDQIGRVALWNGAIAPMVHQNHLIKVRFYIQRCGDWVLNWLLSPGGRDLIQHVASSTSGLHTLSISKVERLPVPLPPTVEQAKANEAVDRASSIVSAAAESVGTNELRTTRLRQSILKWAFEGKLVDQDPNDEPADVLLARIRAEREAAENAPKPKTRKAKRQS